MRLLFLKLTIWLRRNARPGRPCAWNSQSSAWDMPLQKASPVCVRVEHKHTGTLPAIWLRRIARPLPAISIILVVAFSQISFGQEGLIVSELQSRFAQSIKDSLPDVIDAEWKSPIDLWVYADGVDQNTARNIALDVVFIGKAELGQSFCVHVHNGDFKEIAILCWSSP